MAIQVLTDLMNRTDLPVQRIQVAERADAIDPLPLMPGTEAFAHPWLVDWHRQPPQWEPCDIACYSIFGSIISGDGNVWIGDQLVNSPEIMPSYVADALEIASGGSERLRGQSDLPIRLIERPCLVAVGHGIQVYGHFLIEMLFRILVARKAFRGRYAVLLDQAAPQWLLAILENDLNIACIDFEFFDPTRERVRLRHAIVPGRVFIGERVHPYANDLLGELIQGLALPRSAKPRIFITRRHFSNPAAPYRVCVNEAALVEAAKPYGFVPIATEDLPWREQIAVFRDADIIIGQAGSALHTALFSTKGSRLASIGCMNLVQSQIAALRGQKAAYLAKGIELAGAFTVDETLFAGFLDAVCSAG